MPRTTRDWMIVVAAVAIAFGVGINAIPYVPLIYVAAIILGPQIALVAALYVLACQRPRN